MTKITHDKLFELSNLLVELSDMKDFRESDNYIELISASSLLSDFIYKEFIKYDNIQ